MRDVERGEVPAIAVDVAVVVGAAGRIDRRARTEVVADLGQAAFAATPAEQARNLERRARIDHGQPDLAAVRGDRQAGDEQRSGLDERARGQNSTSDSSSERRASGVANDEAGRYVDILGDPRLGTVAAAGVAGVVAEVGHRALLRRPGVAPGTCAWPTC